jgi:hypothetical protein
MDVLRFGTRVCRQLARRDRATRGRSKPSEVGGNLPALNAHGKRARAKSAGAVQFSIVGDQPLKTLTGCLRCWKAPKSTSNDSVLKYGKGAATTLGSATG